VLRRAILTAQSRGATTIRLSIQRRRRWAGALSLIKYGIGYITREQPELGRAIFDIGYRSTKTEQWKGRFIPSLRCSAPTIGDPRADLNLPREEVDLSEESCVETACFVRFNEKCRFRSRASIERVDQLPKFALARNLHRDSAIQ